MKEYFDPSKLTQVPFQDEILGPLAIVFLIVFGAGFVVALGLSLRPPGRVRAHGLHRRLLQRATSAFMWVFGVGLTFFVLRVLGIPVVGWRLWLYVSALALLLLIGYLLYYWRARYPAQLEEYTAQQIKRQYQQANRRRPVGPDGRILPRSPRAEKRRQRGAARTR